MLLYYARRNVDKHLPASDRHPVSVLPRDRMPVAGRKMFVYASVTI